MLLYLINTLLIPGTHSSLVEFSGQAKLACSSACHRLQPLQTKVASVLSLPPSALLFMLASVVGLQIGSLRLLLFRALRQRLGSWFAHQTTPCCKPPALRLQSYS
jgi:hypothetical protein